MTVTNYAEVPRYMQETKNYLDKIGVKGAVGLAAKTGDQIKKIEDFQNRKVINPLLRLGFAVILVGVIVASAFFIPVLAAQITVIACLAAAYLAVGIYNLYVGQYKWEGAGAGAEGLFGLLIGGAIILAASGLLPISETISNALAERQKRSKNAEFEKMLQAEKELLTSNGKLNDILKGIEGKIRENADSLDKSHNSDDIEMYSKRIKSYVDIQGELLYAREYFSSLAKVE